MGRTYEAIVVIHPEVNDEQVKEILEKVRGILQRTGAEVLHHEDWGRKKLSYEIKRVTRGTFHIVRFAAEPSAVTELDRNLKIMEPVIRHQIVRLPAPGSVPAPAAPVPAAAAPAPVAAETNPAPPTTE